MFLYIKTNILRGSAYLNFDFALPGEPASTDVVTLSLVTHLLPSGPVFRDAACLVQPSGQYLHTSTSQYIIPGPGRHLAQFDLQIRPRPAVMAPRSPLRPVENWIISYFVIIKVPDPPWPRWCWLFSHACSGLLLLQLRSRQGDLQSFMTRNKKLMHPT